MEIKYQKVTSVNMADKLQLNVDTKVNLKLFIFLATIPSFGVIGLNEQLEKMEACYAYNIETAYDNMKAKFINVPGVVAFKLLGSIDAETLIEPLEQAKLKAEAKVETRVEILKVAPQNIGAQQFVCNLKYAQESMKKGLTKRDQNDLKRVINKLEIYDAKHR